MMECNTFLHLAFFFWAKPTFCTRQKWYDGACLNVKECYPMREWLLIRCRLCVFRCACEIVCVKNPRRWCSPSDRSVFTSQQVAKEGLLSLLPNKQRHVLVWVQKSLLISYQYQIIRQKHSAKSCDKASSSSVFTQAYESSLWDAIHVFAEACVVLNQTARLNCSFLETYLC